MTYIPGNNWTQSNLVEACEDGKGCEDDGRNDELPFVEDLEKRRLLETGANMSETCRPSDNCASWCIPSVCHAASARRTEAAAHKLQEQLHRGRFAGGVLDHSYRRPKLPWPSCRPCLRKRRDKVRGSRRCWLVQNRMLIAGREDSDSGSRTRLTRKGKGLV